MWGRIIAILFNYLIYNNIKENMAEEVGFEPTVDFHLRRFSRPVHSTTLPLLRQEGEYWFLVMLSRV